MASDRDRRSLRSLRSDRDDSKERGVAFYTLFRYLGILEKTTLTRDHRPPWTSLRAGSATSFSGKSPAVEAIRPFRWTTGPSRLGAGSAGLIVVDGMFPRLTRLIPFP
jgi:hypothetical protein